MIGELIDQGGWVMYVLLGCSVVGIALILERTWYWIRTWPRVKQGPVDRMLESLRQDQKPRGLRENLICDRLLSASRDPDEFRLEAEQALDRFHQSSRRFLIGLSTLVGLAPMLGIFGTILGIIKSFHILSGATITDLDAISVGIAEALITTATGLAIAMPCIVFYNLFLAMSRRAEDRFEQAIDESEPLLVRSAGLQQDERAPEDQSRRAADSQPNPAPGEGSADRTSVREVAGEGSSG